MPLSVVDILFRAKGAGRVKQQVHGIKTSLSSAARMATTLMGPIAGLGAGFALAGMAKKTMDFDKALTQLAIQGHATAEQHAAMRKQIMDTSVATGIGREALREYLQGVTDATGNLVLAKDAMKDVAIAAQVTGADLQGLGTLVSDMSLKFNMGGEEAGKALAILIEQGEKGRYTLAEMAATGSRAMSVANLAGMEGTEGMREMGAMMQIVRQGFGSAEEAATGFKVMVTKLVSSETQKKLDKLGVALRADDGSMRKFGDVFLDVIDKAQGDVQVLADIFGTRGIMGVSNFNKILKDAGGNVEGVKKELDKYRNVTGDATDQAKKWSKAQDTAAVKIEKVKASFTDLIDKTVLTPGVLNAVAESMDNLAISAAGVAFAFDAFKEFLGYIDPAKAKGFGIGLLNAVTGGTGGVLVEGLLGMGEQTQKESAFGGGYGGTAGAVQREYIETYGTSAAGKGGVPAAAEAHMVLAQSLDVFMNGIKKPLTDAVRKGMEGANVTANVEGSGGAKTKKGLKPAGGASASP